jgi:hypothetical protein
MGKLDALKTMFEIAKLGVDISTGISADRRAARAEEERIARERESAEKDRRIRELEEENARLRAKRKK